MKSSEFSRGSKDHSTLWLILSTVACVVVIFLGAILVPATNGAFTAKVTNSTNTAGAKKYFTCAQAINETPGVIFGWLLGNSPGVTNVVSGGLAGNSAYGTATTGTGSFACANDTTKSSMLFNGNPNVAGNGVLSSTAWSISGAANAPVSYSQEVWFKTTSPQGVLMGYTNVQKYRNEIGYGRALWINASGQLMAGTYSKTGPTYTSVTVSKPVTDGAWHHVVVTRDPAGSLSIYLDGELAASVPAGPVPDNIYGYWRVGCMQMSNWPGAPIRANECFAGNMQYVAAYNRPLTATEVQQHYQAGL